MVLDANYAIALTALLFLLVLALVVSWPVSPAQVPATPNTPIPGEAAIADATHALIMKSFASRIAAAQRAHKAIRHIEQERRDYIAGRLRDAQ